ncbi:hypothetical protein [Streptomyces sp. NPDC090798]|uniref:hypothetical protein n=1 Tax=Streptomyces sp. NPDC090798 TaxID=3365968 RepID=UPI00382F0C27
MNGEWDDDELGEEALAALAEHRGIVGTRHLVAVQTFDIARLTTHAVPVVPDTFVAVSGVGPREDSNGSGKTSFLIAVSLLLADPQWRFESSHGSHASGILFKPDAAGVDRAQQMPAASHGYVVGVFTGDPGNPAAGALTVWVRIASSAPYVQANWVDGIHVADALTDAERVQQADTLWQELGPGRALSARRMAEVLYGNAPRCLTYLDTPLRPAVPSLLSQQLTSMKPHDIGEALIALSGMSHLLEQESARRSKALEQALTLQQVQAQHEQDEAEAEATMQGVRARAQARAALEEGQRAWERFLAVSCLQAFQEDHALAADLKDKQEQVRLAQERVEKSRQEMDKLQADTEVAAAAVEARQARSDARQITDDARSTHAVAEATRKLARQEMARLRPEAALWRGTGAKAAHAAVEAARDALSDARQKDRDARKAVEAAEQLVEATEQGRSGSAGQAIEVLDGEIGAVGLMDQLQLEEARPAWESRLWPWRDAVVVPHGQADRARTLLGCLPGALIVEADPVDACTPLPQGVRTRLALGSFLGTLAERMQVLGDPDAARDAGLSLTVVGGFDAPLAGRVARLAQACAVLERRRHDADTAKAGVKTAAATHEAALIEYEAAKATQRLDELEEQDSTLALAVEAAHRAVVKASAKEDTLQKAWERALTALATHEQAKTAARKNLEADRRAHTERRTEHQALEHARTRIAFPRRLQLWGAGVEEAAAVLGLPDVASPVPRPGPLRRQVEQQVRIAYERYGLPGGVPSAVDEDLRRAARLRDDFAEEEESAVPGILYDDMTLPLRVRLSGYAERDLVTAARIEADRAERQQIQAGLVEGAANAARTLQTLQDMIERHLDGLLEEISRAFDELDRQRGGDGAKLQIARERPEGARPWRWHVTPCWKRSARSDYVPYRTNANGAQVKVYAIQLVLAALLADTDTRGRMLILDELGNSLGEVNRKDMLASLRDVARQRHLTILGTCQDSVLADAADVCDELLWFTHASSSDAYNQPTRAWGYDPDGRRVELIADWITAGRSHA